MLLCCGAAEAAPKAEELTGAVPLSDMAKLPTTADQYRSLQKQVEDNKPLVEAARKKSDALNAQAKSLREKLIATAARVQALEAEKTSLDAQVLLLTSDEARLSKEFARGRASVIKLLALLERMQHDMPPAMVLRPHDATGAVHGAMLMGASLPRLYGAAAELARQIAALRKTREALVLRRKQGAAKAVELAAARVELDRLLALKEAEASAAQSQYGELKDRLDSAAGAAANLETLLARVAELRSAPPKAGVKFVTATGGGGGLQPRSLIRPVLGRAVPGGVEGVGGGDAPGLTFLAEPGGQVVTPADGAVLFAGSYHKTGTVLILRIAAGYDLVLAGLDRVSVRPGDQLLAGEPVGTMASTASDNARLYLELRRNGKGVDPAPWLRK